MSGFPCIGRTLVAIDDQDQADTPLLDREGLLRRVGGNEEVAREVYQDIIDSLPALIDQCRRASHTRDLNQLSRTAHTIKGSAATAGAKRTALLAGRLYRACRDHPEDTILQEDVIEALARTVDKLVTMVNTETEGELDNTVDDVNRRP